MGFGLENHYNQKGIEYFNAGNYKLALDFFEKAIVRVPDNKEYLINKAKALEKLERYEESYDLLNKISVRDLKDPIIYGCQGNVLFNLNKYEEAIKCYDKAIELFQQRNINKISEIFQKITVMQGKVKTLEKLNRNGEIKESKEAIQKLSETIKSKGYKGILLKPAIFGCILGLILALLNNAANAHMGLPIPFGILILLILWLLTRNEYRIIKQMEGSKSLLLLLFGFLIFFVIYSVVYLIIAIQ